MKTRSSSGVGQKVDLNFDIAGLRITDLADDEDASDVTNTSAMFDKIKQRSTVSHQEKSISENSIVEENLKSHDALRSMLKRSNN